MCCQQYWRYRQSLSVGQSSGQNGGGGRVGQKTYRQVCTSGLPGLGSIESEACVWNHPQAWSEQHFQPQQLCGTNWSSNRPLPLPGMQRPWDLPLMAKAFRELFSGATVRDQARLMAVFTKESGDWLSALSSPTVSNLLDDESLRIAIALRLGAATCGTPVQMQIAGGCLCCRKSAGRHPRHWMTS